jgi:hypothetical protein
MKYYKYNGNYVTTHTSEFAYEILKNNGINVEYLEDIQQVNEYEAFGAFISLFNIDNYINLTVNYVKLEFNKLSNEIIKLERWNYE